MLAKFENLNKDNKVQIKALKGDYPDKLRSNIMNVYYEKLRIIEKIRNVVITNKLDPTYNNEFQSSDETIQQVLTDNLLPFIVIAISHYTSVEKYFKFWEKDMKGKKEPKYPEINLQPPKDDIVEFAGSVNSW